MNRCLVFPMMMATEMRKRYRYSAASIASGIDLINFDGAPSSAGCVCANCGWSLPQSVTNHYFGGIVATCLPVRLFHVALAAHAVDAVVPAASTAVLAETVVVDFTT